MFCQKITNRYNFSSIYILVLHYLFVLLTITYASKD